MQRSLSRRPASPAPHSYPTSAPGAAARDRAAAHGRDPEARTCPPAPPDSPRKRKRGEGQWALGHREPLNPNERTKKDDDGLNVRARIENVYSKRGFDCIDQADLRGRMRWWGLYTQRAQGSTAAAPVLEPEELDDRYFMLRVRIDGGALTTEQLRALGEISRPTPATPPTSPTARTSSTTGSRSRTCRRSGSGWRAVGLHTTEACGDSPARDPRLAARRHRRRRGARPHARRSTRSRERYIGSKEFSNLPRKFKTAISGLQDVAHEVNDVAFVGVDHPEHGPGFDLWVGGGLSTNPKIAQRLGAWVPLDEVPDVWEGVVCDLPRLRLPPAAAPRADEVPGQGLGRGEIPRRCWRTSTCTAR